MIFDSNYFNFTNMKELKLKKIIHIENEDYDPTFYPIPQDLKHDLTICYKESDAPLLLNKGIISDADVHGTHIRSPYDDNVYYRIESYEYSVWREKIFHISAIARRLGATEVQFKGLFQNTEERQIDFTTGLVYGVTQTQASIDYAKKESETLKNIINDINKFDENATIPTIEEYNEAVAYAKVHHLYNDPDVRNMLDSRNPKDKNLLGERTIHISLCKETNNDLKLALKLGINNIGLQIDAEFKEVVKYVKSIEIDATCKFSLKKG